MAFIVVVSLQKMYCVMSEVRDIMIGDKFVSLSNPAKRISDLYGVYHSELSSYTAHQLFTAETNASTYVPLPHVS